MTRVVVCHERCGSDGTGEGVGGGGTMVGGWREDGRREGVRVGAVDRR